MSVIVAPKSLRVDPLSAAPRMLTEEQAALGELLELFGRRVKFRIMVAAPHPDDECIGVGGSIVKYIRGGHDVYLALVSDTTGIKCAHIPPEEFRRRRLKEEIPRATRTLGIKPENVFILEDQDPWEYDKVSIRFQLREIVQKVKPHILYVPHLQDAHDDHKVVAKAGPSAAGMAPSPWFRDFGDMELVPPVLWVFGYEIWSALPAPQALEPLAEGDVETNMMSLRFYQTQGVVRYEKAYRGRSQFRAAMRGAGSAETAEGLLEGEYAEAFNVLKSPTPLEFLDLVKKMLQGAEI